MLARIIKKNYREYIQDITNKDSYKMDDENFKLWITYLETHPNNATYEGFKRFKKGEI